MRKNKFTIYMIGERIFSNSQKAITLQALKKFGEIDSGKVIFSPFEALFLVETGKAELSRNNKILPYEKLLKIFSKKDFFTRYLIFRELKNKGYIVKTGLKFGAEFRVYDKNNYNKHAKWLVYPLLQKGKINLDEFISKNRIAHSTGKKLLLGIVDNEEKVLFYEISWIKP